MSGSDLEARALRLVERLLAENPAVPGVVLELEAPRIGGSLSLARGVTRFADGEPLTPAHPLRLASNTKTYVAAAVLRLVEEGRLALDDAIDRHLPEEHLRVLRAGGYDPGAITLRHLLTHTSGLYDFGDSPAFTAAVLAEGRAWTRLQQLRGAMAWGRPYGAPGEVYRYSDTGYIALGAILEQATGLPTYGAALRRLLDFGRLGLAATWLERLEPWPAGVPVRAEQYLQGRPNSAFDVSTDLYGGGGLIAALGDVRRFYAALFRGAVFRRPSTLEAMLSSVPAVRGGPQAYGMEQRPGEYRMGILVRPVGGLACYSHGGFFGTQAAYFPEIDACVALGVNVADSDLDGDLLGAVAAELRLAHRLP